MVDSSVISSNSPKKNGNGEKKRYHYSNSSSNMRPNSHGNPNAMHLYSNKNKKYSYSGSNTGLASNSLMRTTSSPIGQSLQNTSSHDPNSIPVKHSRYEPNTINRPNSTGRILGSRYNPEERNQMSSSTTNIPNAFETATSNNSNNNTNSTSRYSGSRYNPQVRPNYPSNLSTSSSTTAIQGSAFPSSSTPSHINSRHRPRSTDPNTSRNPSYGHNNYNYNSTANSKEVNFTLAYNDPAHEGQRNSISSQHKWKSNYSPLSKVPTDNLATSNSSQHIYENEQNLTNTQYKKVTARSNSWKSSKIGKDLTSSYVAPTPKRYNPNSVTKLNSALDTNTTLNTTTPLATTPVKSSRVSDQKPYNKEPYIQGSNFEKYNITESKSIEHSKDYVRSVNPHSLGSSLINSVHIPEKIYKPVDGEQHSRKVSVQKEDKIDDIFPTIENDYKSEISGSPSPILNKKDKHHHTGDYLRKRSLSNALPKIKSSGNLWSQPDNLSKPESSNYTNNETTEKYNDDNSEIKLKSEKVDKISEDKITAVEKLNKKRQIRDQITADYEYIFDPKYLKTDFETVRDNLPVPSGYSTPLVSIDSCIFPMGKAETRLWELKNQSRDEIISKQKYLLKTPIKYITEYPFVKENLLIYKQALNTKLTKSISKIKRYEYLRKLQLKGDYIELKENWDKTCEKLDDISNTLRSEEIAYKKKLEEEEELKRKAEKELIEEQKRSSGGSRRRNRADFVDDTEMESVLLQIDPNYKHFQTAATIPAMIIDPVEKYSMKFKDVNNLVTDKDQWSSRVLFDGLDNFTEYEHELFVEGYLSYPKKFGKISHHMGNLRTPEECVLHYYRTKRNVDYKKLIIEKNKKRKGGVSKKKNKKKEKHTEVNTTVESIAPEEANVDIIGKAKDNEDTTKLTDEIKKSPELENKDIDIISPKIEQPKISIQSINTDNQLTSISSVVNSEPDNAIPLSTDNKIQEDKLLPHRPNGLETLSNSIIAATLLDQKTTATEETSTGNELTDLVSNKRKYDKIEYYSDSEHRSSEAIADTQGYEQHNELMDPNDPNDPNGSKKKFKTHLDHKSSYWSVKEANLFPDLLKQYGSQWTLISSTLGTKSTTMVRNYYQRNAAQLGWKLLVEEADAKLNSATSGSVQQSQILIQPGQQLPNSNALYLPNGVPAQQKPALGFFSNTETEDAASRVNSISSATTQPFAQENVAKDIFSASNPTSVTLPPPRLPSIQLGRQSEMQPATQITNESISGTQAPAPRPASTHQSNRISDLLNSTAVDPLPQVSKNVELPSMSTTTASGTQGQTQSNIRPLISSLLNYDSSQHVSKPVVNNSIPYSYSPVSTVPVITSSGNQNESVQPLQQPQQLPAINFSTDPLAALAAIASASENMSPIVDTKAPPQSNHSDVSKATHN